MQHLIDDLAMTWQPFCALAEQMNAMPASKYHFMWKVYAMEIPKD
jgi:hypothetical protein